MNPNARLGQLLNRALDRIGDLLEVAPDPQSDDYQAELRVLARTVQIVVGTQVKVDQNELRRQASDRMPAILEAIAKFEGKLPRPLV